MILLRCLRPGGFLCRLAVLGLLVPLVLLNARADSETKPRLPMLDNDEAWKRLPGAPQKSQVLPSWARVLAGPLPLTTARMLELDTMHRTGDRLDGRLRALVRWAAADANRCAYSKARAVADLTRALGVATDSEILTKEPSRLPTLDRTAMAFARKMMLHAHEVSDAEVKNLIELAGEERVVALVALLAHASFQDRLFLALDLPVTKDEAYEPITITFGRPARKDPGKIPNTLRVPDKTDSAASANWLELQAGLSKQRTRTARIRIPSQQEVLDRIGPKHPSAWQSDILWSRVCYGYQPELTEAWFDCVSAFRQETQWDPIFSQSIFWVVTRSLKCFY